MRARRKFLIYVAKQAGDTPAEQFESALKVKGGIISLCEDMGGEIDMTWDFADKILLTTYFPNKDVATKAQIDVAELWYGVESWARAKKTPKPSSDPAADLLP